MTEPQATGDGTDITLQERVKLLKVVINKRRYKAGQDIQWKTWTKRITILRSSSFPTNARLEHFPKDARPPLFNGAIELLDNTIVGIKHVAKAKKRNAVEIMFDYHSLLMSFESETIMRRWVEELRRIANHYPMLLTDTINDMMKGYYVLVPEPEQVLVYDVHTKGLAWKWDLTQMQGFQHRRVASEVEITVGSGSSTGAGSCLFMGQRLERFCNSLTEYARNLALKPLGKYSASKSSATLASDVASNVYTTTDNPLVAMRNISVHDTVQDPTVSDKVKMETNPAYREMPSDQNGKGPDPDLLSWKRCNVSKPAGDVNCYQEIPSDQNRKCPDPAYPDLLSWKSCKPAGDVDCYQEMPSDQNRKCSDPAYSDLLSWKSYNITKPAEDVDYYEDIINDQNIKMTENPSYAVP